MSTALFHLAFPITDIDSTRSFYCNILGCQQGRESGHWIDFDFFGHQISAHLSQEPQSGETSEVDNIQVPLRHFGAILPLDQWHSLAERLQQAEIEFVIEPTHRFAGQPGEQYTFFVRDPSGNGLEFKAFPDSNEIYNK